MPACRACGARAAPDARFCSACGAPIVTATGESRRTVTVLFCDVAGSTALARQRDPEAVRAVLSRWFAAASEVLDAHGATVEKFIGDAVMAVFGLPRAAEDDALRAVRAGRALLDRLADLGDELRRDWGAALVVRVGVNTGEVVAGDATLRQSLVTGDAVNTAKRLEEAAGPGELLIGPVTRELVADAAELEPVEVTGRGLPARVAAWRVVAVDATRAGVARRLDAPLVDRAPELQRLEEVLADVTRGRGRLVTVLGQPGIGKSRLARELVSRAAGARVAVARCPPSGEHATFAPVRELLDAAGRAAIDAAVARSRHPDVIRARLRQMTSGAVTGPAARTELFWAVAETMRSLAVPGPLLLVVDDVHWAAPTLLDLLVHLQGRLTDRPVLLLCAARTELLESRPDWPGERVELGPLAAPDVELLLDGLGLDDRALRARVAETAEGNPLFVEQLAALLASGGSLQALPPSIQALLGARLDRLPADDRTALEHAAVAGRDFGVRELRTLSDGRAAPDLVDRLDALAESGFVRPGTTAGRYRFRHGLIREVAYAGIPKLVRADLHERLARDAAEDDRAGFHFERAFSLRTEVGSRDGHTAELGIAAGRRLAAAGRRAYDLDDVPAATRLLGRAVELLPADAGADRLDLLRRLAQAHWEAGNGPAARETLLAVVAEARAQQRPEVAALAELDLQARGLLAPSGAAGELVAAAEAAATVLERAGDDAGLARAWRRASEGHRAEGRAGDAQRAARRALRHARACGDAREEARIVDSLCSCLLYGPTPAAEAIAECEEILRRAAPASSLEANVRSALAGLEAMRGNAGRARSHYRAAAQTFEELGLRTALAGLTQVGVPLELLAGDPEAAELEARRGAELLADTGWAALQAPLLAETLIEQGRYGEAEAVLAGVEAAEAPGLVPWRVKWHAVRSRIAVRHGDAAAAVREAALAVALADATDDLNLRGEAWLARAEATADAADAAEARGHAASLFEAKGNVAAARLAAARAPRE